MEEAIEAGLSTEAIATMIDRRLLRSEERLGIPHTLAELGIDTRQADKVGRMAVADPSSGTNPVAFDADEYRGIFVAAVEGRL